MATVDEVIRDALASIATDVNAIAAAKWLDNRYKEMVSKVKFRHLRVVGELSVPGIYTTGTVTLTRGSTAVVGDSTQFETDIGATAQEYYYFRAGTAWYKIASVTDETNLVLSSVYAEDDAADASYTIVKRYHALASDARWLGDFYHTRLRRTLNSTLSLVELDMLFPGRTLVGNIPLYAVQVGVDSNTVPMYEIYPPPQNSEIFHYIYWTLPPTLSIGSTIPSVIDPYTLKEGIFIDLYRYEKALALRKGNIEQAAVWRNEEKTQCGIHE